MLALGAGLPALTTLGCAVLSIGQTSYLTPVQQRQKHDCAIAALATYLQVDYQKVADAAKQRHLDVEVLGGLTTSQLMQLSSDLGVTLRKESRFNPVQETVIIYVLTKVGTYHAVVIEHGYAIDPSDAVMTPWVLAQEDWQSVYAVMTRY
jgi:ABC-type bacteriocin/lantibiotic exporter with double-glycine peptidase domain